MKNFCFILLLICLLACKTVKPITKEQPIKEVVNPEKEIPLKETKKEVIEEKKVVKIQDTSNTQNKDKNIVTKTSIPKQNTVFERFNHNRFNNLLKKHVAQNGNVNYKDFKTNWTSLKLYLKSLSENMPNNTWSKQDKLAYWINAYNAMTIDLILRHYPIKSIKDIKNPWKQRFWKLGEKWYNLDEIEHTILRKMNEPRIHFAIVCASYSCPKLQNEAFKVSNLESQLTLATKAFLNDFEKNEISKNNLKLSKIFNWFAKDFKKNGSLINFLNQYAKVVISAKAKISYKTYNWDLNE